jgi:hypothetical protein
MSENKALGLIMLAISFAVNEIGSVFSDNDGGNNI